MSLDIQLSPFLTQQLYRNSLYDLATHSDAAEATHLGGYEKKILILVSEDSHPVIADDDLAFLIKILAPCKLNMADVAVVNVSAKATQEKDILAKFEAEKAIIFGVDQNLLTLPIRFPHFQVQPFDNCTYLSAPSLNNLANDVNGKKELWESLRKLFSLN